MHYICFPFSRYYMQIDLNKKLELCLTVVSVLLKIRFAQAKISVPKIEIPMSKTACTNPLHVF